MFGTLVAHDDEGYLLISLRQFLEHGDLYDGTFSQYGPFYYVVFGGLFRLVGREPTLFTGRVVHTTIWMGASVVSGLTVLMLTRRWPAAAVAQLGTFGVLMVLASEPMHPGGLLGLLLAVLAALVVIRPLRERLLTWRSAGIGAVLAALLLTKVNVGAFAAVALAVVLVIGSSAPAWLRAATGLGAVAVPWALMTRDLEHTWARELAAITSLAVALLVLVVWRTGRAERREVTLSWVAAGGAIVGAVTVGVALATGTSVGGLLDGALLRPLRQRSGYTLPFEPSEFLPLLLVLAGTVPVYLKLRSAASSQRREVATATVNGIVGLLLFTSAIEWWPSGGALSFLPLAALIAIDPRDHDSSRVFGRRALVALAVFQGLHAYPVAGSQVGFAAFLLIAVGVVGIVDAIVAVQAHIDVVGRFAAIVAPAFLVAGFVTDDRFDPDLVRTVYEAETALDLPGAGWVRGLPLQVIAYGAMTDALRRHCDTFYSLPGLNSFYIFTGISPPNGLNVGPWMYVLDDGEQREIIDQLERLDRVCVLRNDDELRFWQGDRRRPNGPLVRYLESFSVPIARADNYYVRRRD